MDAFRDFRLMLSEALSAAEQELALEDKGWITSGGSGDGITSNTRVTNLKTSRIYAQRDPLCKQAIRLWTDYSFGTGMTWNSEDEPVKSVLSNFWDSLANQPVLSAKGQRKSSDKLLIDGEIFFAVFPEPSGKATIRRIDPLEITELVTDPDDAEDVRFYKREWMNRQNKQQTAYYRSAFNPNNLPCEDSTGQSVTSDQDAVVFHLAINTIGERGNPLLLPILDWIKLYRQFLASRVAIMLAVSKFLWKVKVGGGATEVNAAQAALHGTTQEPASMWVENQGVQLDQIKTDTGARGAYDDARMLRLQFCAGVGWPEQYFGDLSCYAEDTEVLTEQGWMRHQDWKQGIKVASFDPSRQALEYLEPLELRAFEYHGPMVHFEQAHTDILVTPNHRMWAAKNVQCDLLPPRADPHKGGRRSISEGGPAGVDRTFQFYQAGHILANPRTHGWKFENTIAEFCGNGYRPPLGHSDDKAWATFLGYWLSEGHCLSDKTRTGDTRERVFYRVGLSQKPSPILEKMRDCIASLDYKAHEQTNQGGVKTLIIVNQGLWGYLRGECGINSHDKRLPSGILNANQEMRRALLLALLEGDGGYANGQHSGGWRFSSVSKRLADDVMTLALSLGYATSICQEYKDYRGEPHGIWRVAIREGRKGNCILPDMVDAEAYQGTVYCFALPKNHIYVTRRNGKVAIQGNTGNLATAKTVELPVAKMTQSYQQVWSDFYDSIDNFNFDQASIPDDDSRHVDRDFPSIAPEDQAAMAASIQQIVASFPQFVDLRDVMQQALMSIGVLNTNEVLDELEKIMAKAEKEKAERKALMPAEMQGQMDKPFPQGEDGQPGQPSGNGAEDPSLALAKLLRGFRESIEAKHDHPA